MKKKILLTIGSSIAAVAIFAAGAFAAPAIETISAQINHNMKFSIKGEAWSPTDAKGNAVAPIVYNETTYIPIRSAGEALGLQVGWDGATSTVTLGEAETTTKPAGSSNSVTINNVTVTLNKVVQDDDSLRLYVSYTNNSKEAALTGDSLAKIVSGGTQYEYDHDFNFDRYYEKDIKAPDSIEVGVTADSVIFFPPVENVDKINVVLSANFEDYRFSDVAVTKE